MAKWNKKTDDDLLDKKVTLCEDGIYRWRYDLNLYTNPTIFVLVWKIFFFIMIGIFTFVMLIDMSEWDDYFPDMFLENLKFMGYFLIGMTIVVGIGYLVYAMMMGGKYCVIFEMDENGINHRQVTYQAKKAKKAARATFALGLATRNFTTMGVGINSARTEMYSDFGAVKTIISYPRKNLIKVNETLGHNQVYVRKEDFAYVKEFITTRCKNAKIEEK